VAIIERKLIRQILLDIGFRHLKRVETSHLNLVFSTLPFFFKTPINLKYPFLFSLFLNFRSFG